MTSNLASLIDHTVLDPLAGSSRIDDAVDAAIQFGCASVCVNSVWVPSAVSAAAGTALPVCTVIGFPFGATSSDIKATEAAMAAEQGAMEFDMVLNLGWFLDGEDDLVRDDVAAVRAATDGHVLKVIIESAALDDNQIALASQLSVQAGADFVKTSTGYHPSGGASVEAISIMRETVGPDIGVKASGGIGALAEAEAMIAAGASRIGSSRTETLIAN